MDKWLYIKKILFLRPSMFVIVGIITSALAQIFLKRGSSYEILELRWLVYLLLSLFSYFIAFITYYLALRYYEISKISPIMMASIVSIVALYGFFMGEYMNTMKIIGILFAITSVFMLAGS